MVGKQNTRPGRGGGGLMRPPGVLLLVEPEATLHSFEVAGAISMFNFAASVLTFHPQ